MWNVLLSYRYRPGTYQFFVSAEKKNPYRASVVYFLFSFKHRSHSNKPRSNKSFTHQVPKLDGGEPGLDEWPQAPKEVGCQGEPIFKNTVTVTCLSFFFTFLLYYLVLCHVVSVYTTSYIWAHLLTSTYSPSFTFIWSSSLRLSNPGLDSRR